MYDEDDEDEEFENGRPQRRPLVLAKDIDDEMKAEYVGLIMDGLDAGSAARELGSTGTQFRKHRSPNSQYFDPAFADQVDTALNSGERGRHRLERLEEAAWKAIEKGDIRMLEKFLYAYHPDFEQLRHTNLKVDGEIRVLARQIFPALTDEQIDQKLHEIQQRRAIAALPAPKDEAA